MSVNPAQAVDLAPRPQRPQRMAVSHVERCMAGTLHSWALRAVLFARLEQRGELPRQTIDVWLQPRA